MENENWTRNIQLGGLTLYQLSYFHIARHITKRYASASLVTKYVHSFATPPKNRTCCQLHNYLREAILYLAPLVCVMKNRTSLSFRPMRPDYPLHTYKSSFYVKVEVESHLCLLTQKNQNCQLLPCPELLIVYQATQDAFHIKHFLKTIENDIAPCAIKSRTIKLVDLNHASHFQETVSSL